MYEVSSCVCAAAGPVSSGVEMKTLRKGQLNRHTRYRPATTTRNTATQRSCHSVDFANEMS